MLLLLRGLERLITWVRTIFKPAKSRSLVLKKGKAGTAFTWSPYSISEGSGENLQWNHERDNQSPGNPERAEKLAVSSGQVSTHKEVQGMDQHGILPRCLWPLLIYEVPTFTHPWCTLFTQAQTTSILGVLQNVLACRLCLAKGSSEHILSCCHKALVEERYTWHHNQVLKAVVDTVCTGVQQSKHRLPTRSGQVRNIKHRRSMLGSAHDWQLQVDRGRQLKFPEHIASTTLRLDIVLTSDSSKQVVLVEFTFPWKDWGGLRAEEEFTVPGACWDLQGQWVEGPVWAYWGGL